MLRRSFRRRRRHELGWWKWWLSLSVMDPRKRDSPRNVKVGKCDMR
jgi:hypothetical protein